MNLKIKEHKNENKNTINPFGFTYYKFYKVVYEKSL
jgi:hypothetical protein